MDKIQLTTNGIPILFESIRTSNCTDNTNIIVQGYNSKVQSSSSANSKKIWSGIIHDTRYQTKAVFIINDNQIIEDNDIIKIIAIGAKSAINNTNVALIKKYEILTKGVRFLSSGQLETINFNSNIDFQNIINNNQNNDNSYDNSNNYQNINYHDNYYNNYQQNTNGNRNKEFSNNNNIDNYNKNNKKEIGGGNFMSLNSLSSFNKDILIKVRITKKSDKKVFQNSSKSGSLFTFNIIDEEGTEFPCCAFNKACEKFYDVIEEGKVYEFRGGYIKINDRKYTNLKSEYKYFLDERMVVTPLEDDNSISLNNFNFKKIEEIKNISSEESVDILGYIIKKGEISTIRTKKGEDKNLKKIMIGDDSGFKIEAVIWGKNCEREYNEKSVYALGKLRVGEYQNIKTLSITEASTIIEQIDSQEALNLRLSCENIKEFKEVNSSRQNDDNYVSSSNSIPDNSKTVSEIINMLDEVNDEKARLGVHYIKAYISNFIVSTDKLYYEGCPFCKKKVNSSQENNTCNFCNKTYEKPFYYFTLNFKIKDLTGELYANIIGDIGQTILGKSAEEIKELLDNKEDSEIKRIFTDVDFNQYYFGIVPKITIYNDIKRKKFTVVKVSQVDPVNDTEKIIKDIKSILRI